CYQYRSGWTF
nr:immunoglobulin light chain junction region [Macaca mulatta]